MGKIISRVGETYSRLKIIEELGGGRVSCECLDCGKIQDKNKYTVMSCIAFCRCKDYKQLRSAAGKIFNGLEITKELGNGKVMAECLDCGSEKSYNKYTIVHEERKVTGCGCKGRKIIDRTGETFNNLKIIKELHNSRIMAQCLLCGSIKEYEKASIVSGGTKSCRCSKRRGNDKTGQTFNNLKITKELRGGEVKAQCTLCNYEDTYIKVRLTRGEILCTKCNTKYNYKDKIINNIKVTDLAYTGRDGNKYYNCECIKCSEKLLLKHGEIIAYTCNKEP